MIVYFGSLLVLLLSAFWDTDPFTAEITHSFTLENFQRIFETPVFRDVTWRTLQMAVLVRIADVVLAFPIAYYMARIASPRTRNLLVIAVLLPLWANYLVKAYSWRTILSDGGIINWALEPLGLSFDGYSTVGLWLVFTYLWLPFMILPVYAGLERIPSSLLEASADLGGRSLRTFFRVILPLARAGLASGFALALARGLGEFGATIMFAGSLQGVTQTLPLAIYAEFDRNFDATLAMGALLVVISAALLLTLKLSIAWQASRQSSPSRSGLLSWS